MRTVIAVDGSELAFEAAKYALERAKKDESFDLLHCVDAQEVDGIADEEGEAVVAKVMDGRNEENRSGGRRVLESTAAELRAAFPDASIETHLLAGQARTALLEYIQAHAANISLVVMGSRGLNAVERILLGSTSTSLVQASPVPVLVYKNGKQ